MRRLLFAALIALPLLARATPPAEQWFTVLLDGRKIGRFESTRRVDGGRVETTQRLEITLERAGMRVSLGANESALETVDGKPLSFRSSSRLSGTESSIEGTLKGKTLHVVTRTAGSEAQRDLPWPTGALLPEGQRLANLKAGLAPGTRHSIPAFQPSSLDVAETVTVVGEKQEVDLPGGRLTLSLVEQDINLPGAPTRMRSWVDSDQTLYKMTMPMMGVELTLLACDRACATAPNQGSDVFAQTLVKAPRALDHAELVGTLRYTLAPRNDGKPLNLPDTDEQLVVRSGNDLVVTVRRNGRARGTDKPVDDDRRANDWLQSDAPEIVTLAKRAVGDARTPRARMQRVETFVRGFIRNKNLGVGYASALEVVRNPEGDCTEHAVLVAALGRALGIPTRVVDGLAYAPGFAGKQQIFVPHAWTQAWVDGRWESFDAALDGFDAGHIAFSTGNGDPWRFYAGLDLLGRIEMKAVEAATTP